MRWNALLHPSFEHEAAGPVQASQHTPRRWWLGWVQLLCAWVLCVVLCANIALVFAEGLPQWGSPIHSGKAAGCAVTGSHAHTGPQRAERADPVKGQTPAC